MGRSEWSLPTGPWRPKTAKCPEGVVRSLLGSWMDGLCHTRIELVCVRRWKILEMDAWTLKRGMKCE